MSAETDHDRQMPLTAQEPVRRSGSIFLVLLIAAAIIGCAVA